MSIHQLRRAQFERSSSPADHVHQNSAMVNNNSSFQGSSSTASPTLPLTSPAPLFKARFQEGLGHKRGISQTSSVHATPDEAQQVEARPNQAHCSTRQSLRALPQAPASTPPSKRRSSQHNRTSSIQGCAINDVQNHSPTQKHPPACDALPLMEASSYHLPAGVHASAFATPNLQELQKSSTGHLRALSNFAQSGDNESFSLETAAPSVLGLHNRRQLKRNDSTAAGKSAPGIDGARKYGWAGRNWMDKQRYFLQAYEYLCHIGEAKDWIEDIIHKPIPPIVQLEEALRDGVTLAELVQALYPERQLKIFRHQKLQFRHSDNIALFFRFLEDVELPDLFRFELIDLYEKKNIPKVIYCIHALSWLLYRKGIVSFRIGNLVGQLEFDHHDLEQTQKGLDKAGVSMPSFAGMGATFGAEQEPEAEPEPVESEDERIGRELCQGEATIIGFQSQAKAALLRMMLGETMGRLWQAEDKLIELQARLRGDWARQIAGYRLNMWKFATNLQSVAKGYLGRCRNQDKRRLLNSSSNNVLKLQRLVRGKRARTSVDILRAQARQHEEGIKLFQAALRGAINRTHALARYEASRSTEGSVQVFQALARGTLLRSKRRYQDSQLKQSSANIALLQARSRASMLRQQQVSTRASLEAMSSVWRVLQASTKTKQVRNRISLLKDQLRHQANFISRLQAFARGALMRQTLHAIQLELSRKQESISEGQSRFRGFLLRRRMELDADTLRAQNQVIIDLQGLWRGATERSRVGQQLGELEYVEGDISLLQSLARAMMLRSSVGGVLSELAAQQISIFRLQSAVRGSLVRSRFAEKQKFFKENMEKVVKIQSVVRAKIQGKAYKDLTSGKNPPVGTLKGFVHLLNDGDFDFDEEVEFERLRKTVVQQVRQNELADQYVTQLDIKIALLVKNKITLDEVVKHQRHFGGHVGNLLSNSEISSKDPFDLKALNKASRRKLEHYQELFFLLQTQPQYLARLFRRLREQATAEKECERIKHLMMGLFGYAQKRREEYYLVKLILRSIKEEIDNAGTLQDYLRTPAFWNRLFGAYAKSPRDRKFMRDVLGGLIREHFIENRELDLESDPMQIYLSAINNEELRTGQRSRRDPNVPREQAIRDPETRATFIHHMQDLRDLADQVFGLLEELLHCMPFGVRCIAQQMHSYLVSRFPEEESSHLLHLVGQWVWRNYLQLALSEPEKHGVADRGLTQEQKRNIGEMTKVLNQAALGREFGGENIYLQPLNTYVREATARFGQLWRHGMIC